MTQTTSLQPAVGLPGAGTAAVGTLTPVPRPKAGSIFRSERIKFFSTRSPWFCTLLVAVLAIGFAMLVAGTSQPGENRIYYTLGGMQFAQAIILVMAAMAVTSEYRFGTIRTTFQATPNRVRVLWNKAALIALFALVAGEVIAFAAFFLAKLVAKEPAVLSLSSGTAWRQVAGYGVVYALTSLIAVGIGALIRHTAGAITALLVWVLLAENLVTLIPKVGDDIYRYLPFVNSAMFASDKEFTGINNPLPLWGSVALVAGYGLVIMIIASIVVKRRDA